MNLKYLLLICPSICLATSGAPNMPVQQISSDLGVTTEQFEHCMKTGKEAQAGGEMHKGVVLQCLQKVNPSITADQLKATMMKYKPKS